MDVIYNSANSENSIKSAGGLQPERPVVILVPGMHRSGTSALSGVLNHLGAAIPGELLSRKDDNRKGFFENKRIVAFHDKLLGEFGSRWEDPLPLSQECLHSPNAHAAARELAALFLEEFGERPLVLVKDPRICRLLPVWIEALSRIDRSAVAILPCRHPLDVAASLWRRDSFSRAHALTLWLQHVLAAEHATRGLPRSFVIYDNLLQDWRSVVYKITETLGLAWPQDIIRVAHEIDEFLSSELRHHQSAQDSPLTYDPLHGLCSQAWSALKLLSADNSDETGRATLDDVGREFYGALHILAPLVASLDGEFIRARALTAEISNHEVALAERDARLSALTAEISNHEAALAERDERIERLTQQAIERAAASEVQSSALADKIRSLTDALAGRERLEEQTIEVKERLAAMEAELADLRSDAAKIEEEREQIRRERDAVLSSTFWRLTGPARKSLAVMPPGLRRQARRGAKLGYWLLTPHRTMERVAVLRSRRSQALVVPPYQSETISAQAWEMAPSPSVPGTDAAMTPEAEGPQEARATEDSSPQIAPPLTRFDAWLEVNRWNARQEVYLRRRLAEARTALPKISILMPVYNPSVTLLRRAVESVQLQLYNDWEFCIADDCSTEVETQEFLRSLASDSRIRVTFRSENGHIARAANSAAQSATGEFLVFLDQDDELTVDSLAEIALYISDKPETDLLYSDTDKIDERGRRDDPAFKPDWSPEMLLSFMYAGQVLAVRRQLFRDLEGLRPGFEGSQDHDFALRAGERARHVGHIPKILYHWRSTAGSTARSGNEKPYAAIAGQKAVQEALERRGSRGTAAQPKWAERGGNSLFVHEFPDEGPEVTLIIPTKNARIFLERCIRSLDKTTYRNWRALIIDNDSDERATLNYLATLEHEVARIASPVEGFNFAYLNNKAVAAASTEYVLLLNNDTEVIEPRWLSNMMGYIQLDGVGAVGAQLRFPDGRIQHAGIVHGLHNGLAGHAFKLLPRGENGYMSMAEVPRNYAAVTAACMLTRRSLYLEIGGLDEKNLGVAYNDPDYCYRLLQRGYRVVYTPGAVLTHLETATRGMVDNPREVAVFRERYRTWMDPYYNPNLSLEDEQFRIQPRCVVLGERRAVRMAVFTHNLNWEGAPISQSQTICELKRRGAIEPVVLSPTDGPLRADYEAAGCRVVVAPVTIAPGAALPLYREGVASLAGRLQAFDVELIYANTLETYYALDAARELSLPAVWNVRESEDWRHYFDDLSPEVHRRVYRNFAYPYRVVFVAHATRQRYADLETRYNFTVIHNALAPGPIEAGIRLHNRDAARRQIDVAESDVVFLLLGTVCARKGQHELIEAAMQLTREHWRRTRLFIVGDRPSAYSEDLHALTNMLPEWARRRVCIVPETGDAALYYRGADVFVCTSRVESYPRVILEAMAYALPIISTPVFGIAEQVWEGVNGFFYEPGSPAALAELMGRLLNDTPLREQMGAASPDVLRSLPSFEEMCRRYEEVFLEASLSSVPALAAL